MGYERGGKPQNRHVSSSYKLSIASINTCKLHSLSSDHLLLMRLHQTEQNQRSETDVLKFRSLPLPQEKLMLVPSLQNGY